MSPDVGRQSAAAAAAGGSFVNRVIESSAATVPSPVFRFAAAADATEQHHNQNYYS